MFRHDHVSADDKIVSSAHDLQRPLEQGTGFVRSEVWEPVIATEGDEVETAALLIADEALRHANILHPRSQKRVLI